MGIGVTWGGGGGGGANTPMFFFLPKNTFWGTAELKKGKKN